jgi:hypothetical protein
MILKNYILLNKILFLIILILIILTIIYNFYYYKKVSEISLSPILIKFLKSYGHYVIHSIAVCKRPIDISILLALNIATKFEIEQKIVNHPNHVYLLVTISPPDELNNKINIILEKNEVVDIYFESEIPEKMKAAGLNFDASSVNCLTIINNINDISPTFNLNSLINASVEKLKDKFFYYDCVQNNCQVFAKKIGEMLKKKFKENINPVYNYKFYFQKDAYILLKPYDSVLKIAKSITDILRIITYWKYTD